MDIPEEKRIIKAARYDPEAFGRIFDEYHDAIFGYILRRVGDVRVSQDIVSETFFKALDRLWQFRLRGISILSWLYRIATNEMNQYFRRRHHKDNSLESMLENGQFEPQDKINILQEVIDGEKELARRETWREVKKQIDKLPLKYQEVLALRFFEDKKISEIAEIIGKKEGTVKSLLSRAIAKLATKRADPHFTYEEGTMISMKVDLPENTN